MLEPKHSRQFGANYIRGGFLQGRDTINRAGMLSFPDSRAVQEIVVQVVGTDAIELVLD